MAGGTLLERDTELAELRRAVDAASRGAGRLVVVEGPAGVGKSRLLQAAADAAAALGLTVLSAHGSELEQGVSYGVARELLQPLAGGGALTGPAALAAPLFAGAEDGPGLVQGLFGLVAGALAERAGVLLVDDAQWCDHGSLRFLAYLAQRLDALPAVVLVATRPAPAGSDDPLAALRGRPATILRPRPLGDDAVRVLVHGALGDDASDAVSGACAQVTGGNPFYLGELLAVLAEHRRRASTVEIEQLLPPALLRTTMLRLAALGPAAARLATAVAVLGDGCSLRSAMTLAELNRDDAEPAADALVAAHLLAAGEPLRFTHPLIGSAVRDDMGPFARARAHRRAAAVLQAADAPADRVAAHLVVARPDGDPEVVATLRTAARMAVGRGEPADAVALLERALAEPPSGPRDRAEVLVDLARALARAGRPEALAHLRTALDLFGDPDGDAALLAELARLLHHAGRFGDAAGVARQAAAGLPPDHPLQPGLLAAYLDAAVLDPNLLGEAQVELERLMAGARQGHPPADPRLLAQVAVAMARAGDAPEVVRSLSEAALAADPLVDDSSAGISMAYAVAALEWVDELDAADRLLDAAVEAARSRGAMTALAFASYWRALVGLHRGRLDTALEDAERSLAIYHDGWTGSPFCATAVALVRLARGDIDGAEAAIALGEGESSGRPEDALLLEAKGEVALARGDGQAALAAARASGEVSEGTYGAANPRIFAWRRVAALGAARAGLTEEARSLAGEHVDLARRLGAPRQLGQALHAAGVVQGGDAGLLLLEEAVAVLEGSPARLPLARALVDLGAARRRRGGRSTARQPLERGLALAEGFGAAPLVAEARHQLAAMGRRRRSARTGFAGLTPSQHRVAHLAAHGLSNPEIARRLSLNLKTVETHLTSVYRSLGIAGRGELATTLGGDALQP